MSNLFVDLFVQLLSISDRYLFEDQVSAMLKTIGNMLLEGEKTRHLTPWIFLMPAFFSDF